MANIIQSSEKNPVLVIEQFIKSLDIFINQSIANINSMKNKHKQMAYYWKGEQYNRLTLILSQTIKDAAKELMELQELKKQLVIKADIFRKATNNK